ncbi:hypothetical protein Tco_0462143 [Tanacetum coccineum]
MDGAVLPRTWNIANLKKFYEAASSVRFDKGPEEQSVKALESDPTSRDGQNQLREYGTHLFFSARLTFTAMASFKSNSSLKA